MDVTSCPATMATVMMAEVAMYLDMEPDVQAVT